MTGYTIKQDHPIYRRAVRREGRFWQGQTDDPVNPKDTPSALVAYRRFLETGDEQVDRFTALKKRGPFTRGLSIGCGSANVEVELLRRGIVKEFTFIDISEESLRRLQESLPPQLRRRVKILEQDLNFISLDEKYDFIFCANVLHHLINLEHILVALHGALTEKGILYVDDFIGEDRFQFSDERIARINKIAREAQRHTGITIRPLERTNRNTLINSCPFEAVRSTDIMPILRKLFIPIREREYGGVSGWSSVVVEYNKDKRRAEEAAKIFVAEDKKTRLPPLFVIGIYRKKQSATVRAKPWTKKQIAHHLPVKWFDESIIVRLSGRLQHIIGNGKLYTSLKRMYFRFRR